MQTNNDSNDPRNSIWVLRVSIMAGNPVSGFLHVHYSGLLFPDFPTIATPNWKHWKIPFVWQQVSKLSAMTLLWPDWWLDDPRSALVMEVEQRAKIIPSPVAIKLTNTTKTLQKPEIFSKMALEIVHATAGPCSQYQPPQIGWLELERIGAIGMLEMSSMTWSIPDPYLPVSFQPSPQSLDTNLGEATAHGPMELDCMFWLKRDVYYIYFKVCNMYTWLCKDTQSMFRWWVCQCVLRGNLETVGCL